MDNGAERSGTATKIRQLETSSTVIFKKLSHDGFIQYPTTLTYCRAGGNTEWNYALDVDTLEIEYDPTWEGQAASHVGYEDPTGKQGGYHWMIVGHFRRWRDRAETLTHEVCY
jgi:hypothetical protein